MSVSVPHRVHRVSDAPETASLAHCLSAMKRGLEKINARPSFDEDEDDNNMLQAAAVEWDPVVEIDDLRRRRATDGYQAEDGTAVMRGSSKSSDDLYNEAWVLRYLESNRMLNKNPFYRFAVTVGSQTGHAEQEMIDQSQVQRDTVARAQAASRRLEELRRQQKERDTTTNTIDFQQKRSDDADARVRELEAALADLDAARTCFRDGVDDAALREQVDAINAPFAFRGSPDIEGFGVQLFDFVTRASIAIGGPAAYTSQHQRLRDTIIAAFNAYIVGRHSENAKQIKDDMPRSSNLALNLAVLRRVTENDELLRHITEPKTRLFPADSEYGTQPFLYSNDLVVLAKLLFEGEASDTLLLYERISFMLYAHLNKMRRRAGIGDELELNRPTPPQPPPPSRRGEPRVVNGRSIVFDIDDDVLENMADTSVRNEPSELYTKDQLRAVQTQRQANPSKPETAALLERLLDPMYRLVVPHLFYRELGDYGVDFAAYAGTALPPTTLRAPLGLRSAPLSAVVPLLSAILIEAMLIIDAAVEGDANRDYIQQTVGALSQATTAVFEVSPAAIAAYAKSALGRLIRASGVLVCFAQYALALVAVGEPLVVIDRTREAALRAYVDIVTRRSSVPGSTEDEEFVRIENQAYTIFSSSLLSGTAVQSPTSALFAQQSQKRFQEIINRDTDRVLASVRQRELVQRRKAATKERDMLNKQLDARRIRLEDEESDVQLQLHQVLEESYVPTAATALSPLNSGVLIFSHLLSGAITAAYLDLELYVPCVSDAFGSPAALIVSDEYWRAFASLVQAKLRLIAVRHPVVYQAVVAEKRARIGVRSELDTLRQVAGRDRGVRHIQQRCTCIPLYGAGVSGASRTLSFGGYGTF